MLKIGKFKKNAIYNSICQILMYIIPLISAGYLGRILLPSGIGKASFIQNVVSYFTFLVPLGIPIYGVREIAKCKSETERSSLFSSLLIINFGSTIIFSLLFLLFVFNSNMTKDNQFLYLICGVQIFINIFNTEWFMQGVEEYKFLTLRSIFVRIISILSIFIFVRNKYDIWIYLLIITVTTFLNYFLNIIRIKKYVKFSLKSIKIKIHLKSLFFFIITAISIELYTKIDMTFIGLLLNDEQVGLYSYSSKIVQIIVSVFSAINLVFMPSFSKSYSMDDKDNIIMLIEKIQSFILIISIPCCFGILLLAEELLIVLFGESFIKGEQLLRILSFLIIVMPLGNLYGTQILISIGQEKKKFYATILAAVLNMVFTPILISFLKTEGACLASLLSEFVVLIVYIYITRKKLNINFNFKLIFSIVVSSIIMFLVLFLLKRNINNNILKLCICIPLGVIIYFVSLLIISQEFRLKLKNIKWRK